MENKNIKKKISISNTWQTLILIGTILSFGWGLNATLSSMIFTEDEIKVIAREAAQEVIYDYERETALVDCDDFVRGYLEGSATIEDYIQHCHENKTRVYKGGLLLLDDVYELRPDMEDKYGKQVIRDLINGLIDYAG